MKGIILAGGSGTRLWPITKGISKQLMPIYDKPMIYYPLSTLMMAGIREILIITTPEYNDQFRALLGDGSSSASTSSTRCSRRPTASPRRSSSARSSSATTRVALVLGDNIFHGAGLGSNLQQQHRASTARLIFAYHVAEPEGVRRRRVRRRLPRRLHRGEAGASRRATTPCPASTSTTTGRRDRQDDRAERARRARDLDGQRALPRGRATCRCRSSTAARPGSTPAPSSR